MKLIFAIVGADDANQVVEALIKDTFSVTKLSTRGGFLKRKNTTLMIGVKDEQVQHVLRVIEHNCKVHQEVIPIIGQAGEVSMYSSENVSIPVGGATIFVINAEEYYKV